MGVTSRVYEMLRYIKEKDQKKFEKVKRIFNSSSVEEWM